ncbi:MAG: hypothetical protein A2Y62_21195 [Candidatus Fischerbacteria bacterium RBG_13_37_8]|uniref:Uncharacterized protein n=1 Tax=Candidatus Fischerbacteria bacterium RBG_13_37_8 TaxID=1817863 RepID=A0A1F5V4W6_9BACT|nr:MAG: hypothetical protein A2Y62_21195 [Candidatus Fischerbacteria bacterium RBG_13_37_8]
MTTEQKARKRIKELELEITAYVKSIDYHKSCIAIIEHEQKKAQEEVTKLRERMGCIITLDSALLKYYGK